MRVFKGGRRTKNVSVLYGRGLWRTISKGFEEFNVNIYFRVGDWSRVSLWEPRW